MKAIILSDSFKHCLSSIEVAGAIERGILKAKPKAEVLKIPVADGGEGTVDAFVTATGGSIVEVEAHDPLMRKIKSFYGMLPDGTAVIEMAAVSGIELLKTEERNPLITSTFGVGELILAALNNNATRIIVGLGGSATNDGGVGMAQALGYRFYDAQNKLLGKGGGAIASLNSIDTSRVDERISKVAITAACDVNNLLTGPEGASHVYGPQKGATPEIVVELDRNLGLLGNVIKKDLGVEVSQLEGAGAAGGLGAGIVAFAGGELKPGFEILRETLQLDSLIKKYDVVVTGEGKMDEQTKNGKTPYSVAQLAKKHNKKVIAFAGVLGEGIETLYEYGFSSIFPIAPGPVSIETSLKNADLFLEQASERVFRLL